MELNSQENKSICLPSPHSQPRSCDLPIEDKSNQAPGTKGENAEQPDINSHWAKINLEMVENLIIWINFSFFSFILLGLNQTFSLMQAVLSALYLKSMLAGTG